MDKPYGYVRADGKGVFIYGEHQFTNNQDHDLIPVYTHPKEWVGLTDEDDIDWEEGGNLKDLVKAIEAKLKQKNGFTDEREHMTPAELLHLDAARYATNRKNAYIEKMKLKDVDHMSEDAINGIWLAHYEGYREGYWVATGDAKFSTDPAKLKEKDNA